MKKHRTRKIILWITGGFFLLILLLMSAAYLWQHYYGEEWVKNYIKDRIIKETDSLYRITMTDLSLNLIAGRVTVEDFELIPDTDVYYRLKKKGHVPPFLIHVKVGKLRVRGFETIRAIREKNISVRRIIVDEPEVYLTRMSLPDTVVTDTVKMRKSLSFQVPKGLNSVVLDLLRISKGKFVYTDRTKTPATKIEIPELGVEVRNFSPVKDNVNDPRLFNADDIAVTMKGLKINTPDSLYNISLASIGISSRSNSINLDSLAVKPLVSRKEYFKRKGFQTDQFDVKIAHLGVQGIDYPGILLNNIFHASYLTVENLNINVYRDKRIAPKPGFQPKLPQQALRNLKFRMTIDSISLKGGRAEYEEQIADEPGKIFFDKLEGTVKDFSSDSLVWSKKDLVVNGSCYVMGKGHLQAKIVMPLGAKNSAFTFSGTVSKMSLTDINPMLTKLAPAKIEKGTLDRLVIHPVNANNDVARGTLELYYSDLNVQLENKETSTWSNIKTGAINIAANTYVVNSNPSKNGKFRTGIIYFERDKSKGIFNFLWKSSFSGIKSTMGINNKEQKETKKEKRKREKEEKKKNR